MRAFIMILGLRTVRSLVLDQKVFLVSSFREGIEQNVEARSKLEASVHALEAERIRLAYCPTASYAIKKSSRASPGLQRQRARRDGKARRDAVCKFLSTFGYAIDAITLDFWDGSLKHANHDPGWTYDTVSDVLDSAHIVLVDGGNTFWLWQNIESAKLQLKGVPIYIGVSAGAIAAGRHISTALWKGWDSPDVISPPRNWKNVRGLDLFGGMSFFPHYDEDQWSDLVTQERRRYGEAIEPLVTIGEDEAYIKN